MKKKIKSKLDVVVLLLTALLGDFIIFGFLGGYWWVFDLFANFQVYYFIFAVLGLSYLLLRKRYKWAIMPLLVIIVSGSMIFSPYFGKNDIPSDQDMKSLSNMRVLFYNMFAYNQEYDSIANYVNEQDPDVFIVGEMVKKSYDEMSKLLPQYKYRQWEDGISTGGDIGFFSKLPPKKIDIIVHDEELLIPWFRIEYIINDRPIIVYGIHPSPPMNKELYDFRTKQLSDLSLRVQAEVNPVLVIGDFNTTPYSVLFRKLIKSSDLRDSRVGFGVFASWPNWLPKPLRIPIDHALVSNGVYVINRVVGLISSEHIPFGGGIIDEDAGYTKGSDHFPIVIDIAF